MPTGQKDTTIHIRAPLAQRDLIDRAASLAGKSRSEFMLSSAADKAEEVLLDQVRFRLSSDQWDAFLAALDAPPEPIEALRKTLNTPPPWTE